MSKVAIIMCTWKRLHLLPYTLQLLNDQTNTKFDFYIWNNNSKIKNDINSIDFSKFKFKAFVEHYPQNIGGVGRFYMANKLTDKYKYFIFIDDDLNFDKYLVEHLLEEAQPKTICGWWAYKILSKYDHRQSLKVGEEGDYVGTGGMICPSNIFKNKKLFEELPRKFLFIEDLWLSSFAKYECGYSLKKSKVNINFIPGEDARNQHFGLGALKVEFYEYLKNKYEN